MDLNISIAYKVFVPWLYRDCIRLCTSVGILFYALAIDKLWDEQFRDTMSLGDFYALAGLTAVQFSMELNPSKYYNFTFIDMEIQCMWLIMNKPGLDLKLYLCTPMLWVGEFFWVPLKYIFEVNESSIQGNPGFVYNRLFAKRKPLTFRLSYLLVSARSP